jgi:dipeptidyl aminopeptidase/acylaminoacyl peptidase
MPQKEYIILGNSPIGERKMKKILAAVPVVLIVLLLPLIINQKGLKAVVGSNLVELDYTEVSFRNSHADLQLSGALLVPDGEGLFPTAVIIRGSGPSSRSTTWYGSIAKHLQDNGIAVLIPDKRGCDKSEGNWIGADFEELATDTLSAIEYVKGQQVFEYSTIGVIGMSQGGWISSVVATKSDDLSFVVSISGATVTFDEQLLHEETNNIAQYTYPFIAKIVAPFVVDGLKENDFNSAFNGFDPIPYWKNVDAPVFFAFGDNDPNVPAAASVERLRENDLDHFMIVTYPGGEHGIIDPETYEMNADFLDELTGFIYES